MFMVNEYTSSTKTIIVVVLVVVAVFSKVQDCFEGITPKQDELPERLGLQIPLTNQYPAITASGISDYVTNPL